MVSRHDLVWLSPRGWARACAAAAAANRDAGTATRAADAIAAWGERGWPAVATRLPAGPGPGRVALGIALPPRPADGCKPRIAFDADFDDIDRMRPALSLAEAGAAMTAAPGAPAAFAQWRPLLAALEADAHTAGLTLRVYGSLAFQALTGQPYLTDCSDVDLLLQPQCVADYHAALALLRRHARALPLDGEIVFADGCAVAWKELAAAPGNGARVLAKSLRTVALVTVDSLLATLEERVQCSI